MELRKNMAIPDYQTVMLPLLKFIGDKKEHSVREAVDSLSEYFKLTNEERRELLQSGQQEVFVNRVGWARTYMKKAGLLESTRRGYFKITDRGLQVLEKNPNKINVKYLDQYKEFKEFRTIMSYITCKNIFENGAAPIKLYFTKNNQKHRRLRREKDTTFRESKQGNI